MYCRGITFKIEKNKINFVGTDNVKLAIASANVESKVDVNNELEKINIPRKTLKKILALISKLEEDDKIVFHLSPYLTKVTIENFYFKINIVTKNLDESIPDFSSILEKFNDECNIVKVNKANLFSALKKVAIFTNDENTVIVKADNKKIILTGNNSLIGKGEVTVNNCMAHEPVMFMVNYECLNILENYLPDEFEIKINDSNSPMLIKEGFTYIFAPIAIEETDDIEEVA